MTVKTTKFLSQSQSGFTLIELAIVMIIISLLSLPLLQRYKVFNEQEKIDNTTIAMTSLNSAIGDFYIQNGYYPCPADRTIPFGTNGAGESQCDAAAPYNKLTAIAPNSCNAGNGLCKVTGAPGLVYTGGIPYATLKIPYTQMIDGYRNLISYSVSADYADSTKPNDTARVGAITMNTETVDPTSGLIKTTPVPNIFYMLVSAGEDGKGSFNVDGKQKPCTAGAKDSENCNLDAVFLDRGSLRSYVEGANYYDDRIAPMAFAPTSIWALSTDTPGAVYNTNKDAIGIGTKTPDAAVKLDVNGDVKAQQFRGDYYCDKSGTNCFQTKTIAGDPATGTGGLACGTGQYLTGIANNIQKCNQMAIDVTPKTCGSNEYVSGIDVSGGKGVVICKTLPTP